jgi:6-phosphogluconolactonase/glucosamine-6-phosphate isomerase/deaminase
VAANDEFPLVAARHIEAALRDGGPDVLSIALSGGSTPGPVYELLRDKAMMP